MRHSARWGIAMVLVAATAACSAVIGLKDVPIPAGATDGGNTDVANADVTTDGPIATGVDGTAASDASGDGARADAAMEAEGAGPTCAVAGNVYAGGDVNPGSDCQSCQPNLSAVTWTNDTDGTLCGSGGICYAGACVSGCEIAGVYFTASAFNPNNACQSCQPAVSTSGWSAIPDGTGCGNNQLCSSGACGTQCDIAGTIYPSGGTNPANACQSCQPGTSTSTWTNAADGASCGAGEVCKTAVCAAGCFIGGTVYASGGVNPSAACQVCQPAKSTTAWTVSSDETSCAGGTCCSGTCVNEATDLGHCGACGNACTAGPSPACSMGKFCEYTLATAQGDPLGIAVDGKNVYWTNDYVHNNIGNTVMQLPVGGGTATTLGTNQLFAMAIAVDAANVYWTVENSILKTPIGGGTVTPLVTAQADPNGIAVDATNIYWINMLGGEVSTMPSGGGTITILTTEQQNLTSIAIDATNVYFTNGLSGGNVAKVPIAGGAVVTLASAPTGAGAVAVDATSVYWGAANGVFKVPIGGGTTTTLVPGQAATGIAVDATNVYYTASSAVMKVPIGGGTPTTLASGQTSPIGIALDVANVFWTNAIVTGTVMKVQK